MRNARLLGLVLTLAIAGLASAGGWGAPGAPPGSPTAMDGSTSEDDIEGRIHTYWYQAEVPGQGCLSKSVSQEVLTMTVVATATSCGGGLVPFVPWEFTRGVLSNVRTDTKTILMEMAWEAENPPLGEHLRLRLRCAEWGNDTSHPCYILPEQQTSPIRIRVDEEHWLEHGYGPMGLWSWAVLPGYGALGTHAATGVDVGASYQQTYTIYVTIFHGEPAPADYSRLPAP